MPEGTNFRLRSMVGKRRRYGRIADKRKKAFPTIRRETICVPMRETAELLF